MKAYGELEDELDSFRTSLPEGLDILTLGTDPPPASIENTTGCIPKPGKEKSLATVRNCTSISL
jgi:hypothetical protein